MYVPCTAWPAEPSIFVRHDHSPSNTRKRNIGGEPFHCELSSVFMLETRVYTRISRSSPRTGWKRTSGPLQGVHYQNVDRFDQYIDRVEKGEHPVYRALRLDSEEQLRREVILQLKTGILDGAYFRQKFGVEVKDVFAEEFVKLVQLGFLHVEGDSLRLSRRGLLQVDWFLPWFYLPQHCGIRYT